MTLKLIVEDKTWEIVAAKYGKSVKSMDEDAEVLQNWMETYNFPKIFDQNCLRNFLILNKFSVEVSKQKIENYYTIRSRMEEFYAEINPKFPYYQQISEKLYMVGYSELTPDAYRIAYFKIKNFSLIKTFDIVDVAKKLLNIQEVRLRKDILFGDIFVFDMTGLTAAIILTFSPNILQKMLQIYEGVFSFRMKAAYLVNIPPLFVKILHAVKKIIKPKIFERIFVLESVDDLKSVIDVKFLPKDYGGLGHSFQELDELVENNIKENQGLFDLLDEIKVEGSLTQKDSYDDYLGIQGNFKKLEID